jgi:hypothetical protein
VGADALLRGLRGREGDAEALGAGAAAGELGRVVVRVEGGGGGGRGRGRAEAAARVAVASGVVRGREAKLGGPAPALLLLLGAEKVDAGGEARARDALAAGLEAQVGARAGRLDKLNAEALGSVFVRAGVREKVEASGGRRRRGSGARAASVARRVVASPLAVLLARLVQGARALGLLGQAKEDGRARLLRGRVVGHDGGRSSDARGSSPVFFCAPSFSGRREEEEE